MFTRTGEDAGRRLWRLRQLSGLTQKDLAERSGLSAKTVQRVERGHVPGRREQALLAAALGVPASSIWQAPPQPASPGARLRTLREERGLSPAHVAARAGISAEHLRRIERGEVRRPSDRTLARLCTQLGSEVADAWPDFREGQMELAELISTAPAWKLPGEAAGRRGRIRIVHGTVGAPPGTPLVAGASSGWGPLDLELRGERWMPHRERIGAVVDALAGARDGLFLAYVDLPGAPRPLALCPTDQSSFHSLHHPSHGIWHDFFRDAARAAIAGADRRFGADHVRLGHPTVSGWPAELAVAVLEGIGHFVDTADPPPRLGTLHVETCCLPEPTALERAIARLNAEQLEGAPPPGRLEVRPVAAEALGLEPVAGIELEEVRGSFGARPGR